MEMELGKQRHKITVSDMAPHVHNFGVHENKVNKIAKWLINWLTLSLECGKIKPNDLMPSKADLACHIGVSQGTIQNAFRIVEDFGYLESKQRVGTFVKDFRKENSIEKLTSKRELTVEIIKKYIIENDYHIGDKLPSTRKLSSFIGVSPATIRVAIINLISQGIIDKQENAFILTDSNFCTEIIESKTLVEKISKKIENYIDENLKSGDKLPTNSKLAKKFNVSIKTIHDAIKNLTKKGILCTRRGQYGTIVLGSENNIKTELYNYEKIEQKIRNYIIKNCQINDKLPPIKEFAILYKTSEKTVKKALDNLSSEGFVAFARGRYGGTYVIDIPQASGEAYKWLAISTEYISN